MDFVAAPVKLADGGLAHEGICQACHITVLQGPLPVAAADIGVFLVNDEGLGPGFADGLQELQIGVDAAASRTYGSIIFHLAGHENDGPVGRQSGQVCHRTDVIFSDAATAQFFPQGACLLQKAGILDAVADQLLQAAGLARVIIDPQIVKYQGARTDKVRSQSFGYAHAKDNAAKIVFGDPVLCAQFLKGYTDIPLFKEIKPEDIENVSSHFLPLFQESRDSDTVNKIRIGNSEIYLIALIEHQSENDFDMSFRILRYIVFIWTDYAAQQECPR